MYQNSKLRVEITGRVGCKGKATARSTRGVISDNRGNARDQINRTKTQKMMTLKFRFRGAQWHQKKRPRAVSCRCRSSAIRAGASSDLTPHFTLLGLTPFASKSDVKQAYRHLALRYHPDVYKTEDCLVKESAFRDIKSAYECLMQKFQEDEDAMKQRQSHMQRVRGFDEYDEWEEWMGFEGGIPVVYNPF